MANVVSDLMGIGLVRELRKRSRWIRSSPRVNAAIRQADDARGRRDWQEAARLYGEVLKANPSLLDIQVQLGHAYKELGDFDNAGSQYQAVLRLTPFDDDLHLQIGHLEKLKGDLREAACCYRKAVELNPDNTDALIEYWSLASKLDLQPFTFPGAAQTCEGTGQTFSSAVEPSRYPEPLPGDRERRDRRLNESIVHEQAYGDSRLAKSGDKPKLLFVSDSLGTPIHARGIFHYSVALAEIFGDLGFEVTLIVEKSSEYGVPRHTLNKKSSLSEESLNTYYRSDIYRYFNNELFSFRWKYETRGLQLLVERWPFVVRLAQRIREKVVGRQQYLVNNLPREIGTYMSTGRHLAQFDRFLYVDGFYSDSMSNAVNDLNPVGLNAAGYDVVLIDTPHYVRVTNIDRSHIFTVIHDLIPLQDPFMGPDWRRLFLGKLRASLATGGNLIFVSEYTRSLFHSLFPGCRAKGEFVLYPSIPKSWMDQATPAEPGAKSEYITGLAPYRVTYRHRLIRERAARLSSDSEMRAKLINELEVELPSWDSSLRYFVTVTSDEPRKNVAIFTKISTQFVYKANFIIIGQVDGDRLMNNEPEMYPNLHFTGYLEDYRKADLIRHAAGVIFPSFAEGFGIPIVEGALFQVPVVCSDLPVFREITRNLAIYFDPQNPDELALRINDVLSNPKVFAASAFKLREFASRRFSQRVTKGRLCQALVNIGVLPLGTADHQGGRASRG
jgi:glycosyltransferase involved in cell wall biosynthesis